MSKTSMISKQISKLIHEHDIQYKRLNSLKERYEALEQEINELELENLKICEDNKTSNSYIKKLEMQNRYMNYIIECNIDTIKEPYPRSQVCSRCLEYCYKFTGDYFDAPKNFLSLYEIKFPVYRCQNCGYSNNPDGPIMRHQKRIE